MILRTWSARATEAGAAQYCDYFEHTLLPELRTRTGFVGAQLATRPLDGLIEITAHTTWASLDAIRAFAGDDPTAAKVEPEALAMLEDSDPAVVHRDVRVSG
ncbi:antibiotic biosynthesis monooxygenase family protein [Actinophytocola sp. KF-1]